ncbi:Retinol dehydrogenase 14 [Wickerhamomyces ciferrii]|uniref:Retinol dehydrogenase 14 n=1 Tax=Wickerhamomyces ciferrii (strain ATCC 14091 / BCRC 22168 / CBS 111 / JCM 3599 / NBRC 0793 / NRRL Y-1031 F-60-10) TaxID=1206466 RepID=K0KP86_WICCF|nr:Retinol dehydrogenase 14 [Wickerhamomyces ciferrii]CCH43199.1 Retinol dehydrogenase 14 [Wickerhamomyces ciferrii]
MVSFLLEALKDASPSAPGFLPKDYPDLSDKIALITGSSSGIGYETAKALLKQNATVIMVNRNQEKVLDSVAKIKKELVDMDLDSKIYLIQADLSDLTTIKPAVEKFFANNSQFDKLHYSIYNAGVMRPPKDSFSKQGYELQIGTNVLGHHLLNKLIEPLIINGVDAKQNFIPRVIWLASIAHFASPANGGINWESFKDGEFGQSRAAYGQSKTGNIYQSYVQSTRLKNHGVISLSVHPGYLASDLSRSLGSVGDYIWKTVTYPPVYGSYSVLFGALNPDIELKDSGRYIGPWGQFKELRDDINQGLADGTASKFEQWADEQVKPYL